MEIIFDEKLKSRAIQSGQATALIHRSCIMQIIFDEEKCVRCGACVGESECGGIFFSDGRICVDENRAEDWTSIAAVCPTNALKIKKETPQTKSERSKLKEGAPN